ncbi:MAG: hypothetical protein AB7F86_18575, partial [Bdellovibrionales bacterium]
LRKLGLETVFLEYETNALSQQFLPKAYGVRLISNDETTDFAKMMKEAGKKHRVFFRVDDGEFVGLEKVGAFARGDEVVLRSSWLKDAVGRDPDGARNLLGHEIQHAVRYSICQRTGRHCDSIIDYAAENPKGPSIGPSIYGQRFRGDEVEAYRIGGRLGNSDYRAYSNQFVLKERQYVQGALSTLQTRGTNAIRMTAGKALQIRVEVNGGQAVWVTLPPQVRKNGVVNPGPLAYARNTLERRLQQLNIWARHAHK